MTEESVEGYAPVTFVAPVARIVAWQQGYIIYVYPGVYKVPRNLIFFPTLIFKKLDFLPQTFSLLPLFPTR